MYLDDPITSHGFQPIAIIHSLPDALFVWAMFLFMIQYFFFTNMPLSFAHTRNF